MSKRVNNKRGNRVGGARRQKSSKVRAVPKADMVTQAVHNELRAAQRQARDTARIQEFMAKQADKRTSSAELQALNASFMKRVVGRLRGLFGGASRAR